MDKKREIKQFLQYSSGVAIVDYEETFKPTSFWVVFQQEISDQINAYILKLANDLSTHMKEHCECDVCCNIRATQKKQRKKEK